MNDEQEPFEQCLGRQPLRPVPADWRAGILRAAQTVQENEKSVRLTVTGQTGWRQVVERELRALVWPNPKAWAGLAAAWILIAIINFSMRDNTPQITEKSVPPSPAAVAELRNQQRMFVELSGLGETQEADRQKNIPPKPHSERTEFRLI